MISDIYLSVLRYTAVIEIFVSLVVASAQPLELHNFVGILTDIAVKRLPFLTKTLKFRQSKGKFSACYLNACN